MLVSLHIQNVVLIENLTIDFKDGLCALTGETGAGKSILLDSLGLATGMRAESRLVRTGTDAAQVTATFDVEDTHIAFKILQDNMVAIDAGEGLILRRNVGKDGKSKAFINDNPVSAKLLRDIGDTVLEIHGQFDSHALLNAASHLGVLDEYAGAGQTCEKPWHLWRTETKKLELMKAEMEDLREEEEYLRQAIEDLDQLNPQEGEEEKLAKQKESLKQRESILSNLDKTSKVLNANDAPIRKAWGAMEKIVDFLGEQGKEALEAIDRTTAELEEARSQVQKLFYDYSNSADNLGDIDDRLYALRAQARKHGCKVDDLPQTRRDLAERLHKIEHTDDLLEEQMRKVTDARESYIKTAQNLSEKRKGASDKLAKSVMKELPPLKLEKAKFMVECEKLPEENWGPNGMDQVQFLVSTNPGSAPGPLGKIASGGELARLMLALKVVMSDTGSACTLVFDEVDAGVGGAVADAVGKRLAQVSKDKQVLVVTHAPQIAARADEHYIVSKDGAKAVTTNVIHLHEIPVRREEIARMLSGANITDEARAAADKLMEAAQ